MSINSPKVYVVISACHQIQYLSQTINSVLQQTSADFEILLFSNCCLADLESLDLPPDKRLKFIFPRNLPSFEIFNLGITKAQGRYITFVKIRDLWHPDKLNKQVFCLDHYPNLGLVHSWAILINHHQKSPGKICQYNLSGWVEKEILKRNQINFSSVILRRRCLDT